jgi:hypothetical protein
MQHDSSDRPAASTRAVEMSVAVLIFAIGAIVMWDSVRLGASWADDGPQAGYFPFYIGLLVCLSTGVIFFRALVSPRTGAHAFVSRGQLLLVLKMLVPTIAYVVLIKLLGIYVASTLYIAFFMKWLGKYPWAKTLAVAIGVSVIFFLLFEMWFKVPLPKGPLEAWLGLD